MVSHAQLGAEDRDPLEAQGRVPEPTLSDLRRSFRSLSVDPRATGNSERFESRHCVSRRWNPAAKSSEKIKLPRMGRKFDVNVLSPLALTHALWSRLAAQAKEIFAASELHRPGSRGAELDFQIEDPDLQNGYQHERAYRNSKLTLLWVMKELDRRAPRSKRELCL